MIQGMTVEVLARDDTGVDDFGMPVSGWRVTATVDDVLAAPTSTQDLPSDVWMNGDKTTITFHFPKTFTGSLRGCRIRAVTSRDSLWEVIGDPQPYMAGLTPGPWNRPVVTWQVKE